MKLETYRRADLYMNQIERNKQHLAEIEAAIQTALFPDQTPMRRDYQDRIDYFTHDIEVLQQKFKDL